MTQRELPLVWRIEWVQVFPGLIYWHCPRCDEMYDSLETACFHCGFLRPTKRTVLKD